MATRSKATFQKRQKEMKRLEKQRMKADRRAQKSLARRTGIQIPAEGDLEIISSDAELQTDEGGLDAAHSSAELPAHSGPAE
jgi:hypothetical protein